MRAIIFKYLDDKTVKVYDLINETQTEVELSVDDPKMKEYGELIFKEFEESEELCDFIPLDDNVFLHILRGV